LIAGGYQRYEILNVCKLGDDFRLEKNLRTKEASVADLSNYAEHELFNQNEVERVFILQHGT
jgi:tetraacyldisaccharide-1-P 4'-kinase